jgi:phage/plasmid-associated DNA primase
MILRFTLPHMKTKPPGLLNLALVALRQLHKDGGFKDMSVEEIRKEYDENSNAVKGFLDDKCVIDLTASEYYALTINVYNEYLNFCKEKIKDLLR